MDTLNRQCFVVCALFSSCLSSPSEEMVQVDVGKDAQSIADTRVEDVGLDNARDQRIECDFEWTGEWEKQGRLFPVDPTPANASEGDFAPSVVATGEGYRVYFSRRRGNGFSLWTSTSVDGGVWADPQPLEGFDSDSYASVIWDDGAHMWFGSGSFEYAFSANGVDFDARTSGILRPSDIGGFANLSIIYPEVRRDDETFRMWFTGFDGETLRIGTATSPDGFEWTADVEPVLERTGGDNFDSTSVGQSSVLRGESRWWMWYGGYDTSQTDPGPWRIGLAVSVDGETWDRRGISIPLALTGDDMWSTRDPSVVKTDDGLLMVYVGMSDDSHYRLLSATQPCAQ